MQEGTVLRNNYRVSRLIGRGGMADVYLAFDMRRHTHVALKVLREDLGEDPDFIRRFAREAEALARLDHPNIVRFYSFERQGAAAFIVMDYVPGTSLQRHIAEHEGSMALQDISDILHQVGAALHYAHNQGYVHRDIKPGNIMLRENGETLLSDFGIARAAESATAATVTLGTPAYMSPEQILGRELDQRSDIYSLGVVLYELATGRRPFTGDEPGVTGTSTLARMREAHLRLPPPDPRVLNPALPAGLAGVIMRALAKDPADRFQDVMSLVQAWERVIAQTAAAGDTSAAGAGALARTDDQPPNWTPTPRRAAPTPLTRSTGATPPSGIPPEAVPATPAARGRSPWPYVAGAGGLGLLILAVIVWRLVMMSSAPAAPPTATYAPPIATATATTTPDVPATAQALAAAYALATARAEATFQARVDAAVRLTEEARTPTRQLPSPPPSPSPSRAEATKEPASSPSQEATPTAPLVASASTLPPATDSPTETQTPPGATPSATPKPALIPRALIAYTVTEKFRDRYQVFLINSDGSGLRLLSDLASEPSFSPDGGQIVFYSWPGGLDVMNVDGSGRHTIVNDGESSFPAWSPDGQWIAFHSLRSSRFDVYLVRPDGREEHVLADGEQASWSPDSKRLVYKGCLGNNCGLMIVNLDGSGKRRLTDAADDGNADWSRDNGRIVFTSLRDGNHEIYVVRPDGSGLTRLTNSPGPDAMPVWLPGGQQIAFRSARSGSWAIWIMNADGSGVRKLVDAKVDPDRWIWEKMAATRR